MTIFGKVIPQNEKTKEDHMKKLRILGLVSMLVLIFALGAIIVLALLGILKIEERPDGTGSEIIFVPIGSENP